MKDYFLTKIAEIENGFNEKFGVPRQSGLTPSVESKIIFEKEFRDENLLRGIEQYSHLWLVFGFSENEGKWSPTVRPPKLGGNKRVGVFATRSPFRPNSLGLSVVRLVRIENSEKGKVLVVAGADLVSGTPIFDIKPYLPYVDSVPEANGGFSEEHKNDFYEVEFSDEVKLLLTKQEISELTEILRLNPKPSYKDDENRVYGLSFKDMNVKFSCSNNTIYVTEIRRD